MTAAPWKTTLPQATEVAPSSGVAPEATLINQPALGMRNCPGPFGLGGWLTMVVLVARPSGPAVTGLSVKVGGLKTASMRMPVVGAGAPQTPRRIWAACVLPGARPARVTV